MLAQGTPRSAVALQQHWVSVVRTSLMTADFFEVEVETSVAFASAASAVGDALSHLLASADSVSGAWIRPPSRCSRASGAWRAASGRRHERAGPRE